MNLSNFTSGILSVAALLIFAGIFKSVGYFVAQYVDKSNTQVIMWTNIIKNIGQIFFTLIAFMFVLAIVASFTQEAFAVFTAAIAWMTLLLMNSSLTIQRGGNFYAFDWIKIDANVGKVFGFSTLNPGILWAFIVAAITIYTWNKFKDIKFHKYFAFWEGKRFVPFMAVIFMIPTSLIFMLIWPFVGMGLNKLSNNMAGWPAGIDSLGFGLINWLLIPFGLHHFWYSPFIYGAAGGALSGLESFNVDFIDHNGFLWNKGTPIYLIFENYKNFDSKLVTSSGVGRDIFQNGSIEGDKSLLLALGGNLQLDYSMLSDHLVVPTDINVYRASLMKTTSGAVNSIDFNGLATQTGSKLSSISVNMGRFMSGASFSTWFGVPGATAAMVLLADKDKRKSTFYLLFGGWISAFIGLSEPFMYTFLFTAPWLYFGVNAPLAAINTALGNVLDMHFIGEKFILFLTTGFIPGVQGQDTHYWKLWAFGPIISAVWFAAFYWAIRLGKLDTPGRMGREVKFATKIEAKAKIGIKLKSKNEDSRTKNDPKKSKIKKTGDLKINQLIKVLGGKSNIKNVNNCATRLRVDLTDSSLVEEDKIKSLGAYGHIFLGKNHIQIIYGQVVQRVRDALDKELKK